MKMTRHEFLITSGLHTRRLESLIERRWLIPEVSSSDNILFSEVDVARARFIGELKDKFGANDEGIEIILHLVDQLHGIRYALSLLQRNGS